MNNDVTTPVILSYGLGVDSTAILLRWIHEPSSRDFDLSDLIVLTAMTGNEWEQSGQLVEQHMLPLFRAHGIRYIQIARHGAVKADGITILDDSRNPQKVYLEGDYTLENEMLSGGTVPQSGGVRKCSIKAKGEPLDYIIEQLIGGKDVPFRHFMGFESEEQGRANKDTLLGTKTLTNRSGEYPLIEWGWNRKVCLEYIKSITGADWIKSACVFCPFAISDKEGPERILSLYRQHPQQAAQALFMEHIALLFNENQSLTPKKSLYDLLVADGNTAALDALDARLQATPHATYHLRRFFHSKDGSGKGTWYRSVGRISEPELLGSFTAAEGRTMIETVRERGEGVVEESFIIAPAVVIDKHCRHGKEWFDAHWTELTAAA